jgi:murein DD-endopeptidase MepM/ murein hydrolase activator NlpD
MSLRRTTLVGVAVVAMVAGPRLQATASAVRQSPATSSFTRGAIPFAPVYGTYAWPVVGRIIDPFRLPFGPFGAGHRGIDIASPVGTPVHAASGGVVAFAGSVAGSLFVSIDHPDGVRTTYGYLSSVAVSKGDAVARNQVIAASALGHPGKSPPHLHFGARLDGRYIDPQPLLMPLAVWPLLHLGPLPASPGGGPV